MIIFAPYVSVAGLLPILIVHVHVIENELQNGGITLRDTSILQT
jgi:hypothetical protein